MGHCKCEKCEKLRGDLLAAGIEHNLGEYAGKLVVENRSLRAQRDAAIALLREWIDMYAFTHEADGSRNSVDYAYIDDVRERTEALLAEVTLC